jgi:2,5-dihydroxypyridine 5,6-dioxygenase
MGLVELFKEELRLCGLESRETLLIFTDPQFAYPEYAGAAFAAAQAIGAQVVIETVPTNTDLSSSFILETWKSADLVLGITTIPWLYTQAHNEALAHGTRTLLIEENFNNLKRLFPCKEVISRTFAGARKMAKAKEIRITDDAGSDFTLRKDDRKGHAQVGIADKPGRWDHWPSGLVACAPIENSAEGTYIINPGDVLLHLRKHVSTQIRITLHEGLATSIEGGHDANLLREYLEKFDDPNTLRISHAGWGTDHRANWGVIGMDSESYHGSVMVSLGSNMFDANDEFSGLGGKNCTEGHFDICCRNKRLQLDGELIIDQGSIVDNSIA